MANKLGKDLAVALNHSFIFSGLAAQSQTRAEISGLDDGLDSEEVIFKQFEQEQLPFHLWISVDGLVVLWARQDGYGEWRLAKTWTQVPLQQIAAEVAVDISQFLLGKYVTGGLLK